MWVAGRGGGGLGAPPGGGAPAAGGVDPRTVLTPAHKPPIVDGLLAEYDLTRQDCVAYGDSSSDVPLFEHLPHSVAVNGTSAVLDIATARYDGNDLREAYRLGRGLLDG